MTKTFLAALVAAIKTMRENADDETALAAAAVYPEWLPGTDYAAGDRVRYGEHLYKVVTAHTSQIEWTPDAAASLFEAIAMPSESGTIDNPIEYTLGMALEKDKYYTDDDALYFCFRETGVPVYNPLAALIGIYVDYVDAAGANPENRNAGESDA